MEYKKIAIIVNTSKDVAVEHASRLIIWLKKKNIEVKVAEEDASQLKCDAHACTKDELISNTDLVITMGGDGTVLRAVSLVQTLKIPILAINFGKFGFLQEIDAQNIYDDIEKVLKGDCVVDERKLIEVKFKNSKYYVLNDLVLSHDGFRIMHLEAYINGTFFFEYAADGLAVSTPTGATAYSFSAGGPIVNPKSDVNILTPINTHSLLNRSVVLNSKDKIKFKVASINGNLKIAVDGLVVYQDEPIEVDVTGSNEVARLIRIKERDFFKFFRNKLKTLSGVNGVD